jgi:hypothetical protein
LPRANFFGFSWNIGWGIKNWPKIKIDKYFIFDEIGTNKKIKLKQEGRGFKIEKNS